jgi:choline dehydrogenase-like flavoprotein
LVVLRAVPVGDTLIQQADEDSDLFLIFEGEFQVLVGGAVVAKRGAGDHIGEIAAIQPALKRTATVVAKSDAVVGKLTQSILTDIGDRYPSVYKAIAQQAGRGLTGEAAPVPSPVGRRSSGPEFQTDAELAELAGQIATTIFHPVGTTSMGLADDEMAVVDPHLRVRGVDDLRVADAGIMPTITSGNTNAPTLAIAEKAAGWIVGEGRARKAASV